MKILELGLKRLLVPGKTYLTLEKKRQASHSVVQSDYSAFVSDYRSFSSSNNCSTSSFYIFVSKSNSTSSLKTAARCCLIYLKLC